MVIWIYGWPMKPIYNSGNDTIRLSSLLNLIFFAWLFLLACKNETDNKISIIWENNKAIAFSIPRNLIRKTTNSPNDEGLHVSLKNHHPGSILGRLDSFPDRITFTPALPFTRGLSYELYRGNRQIDEIIIPIEQGLNPPQILATYPSRDTLPANLLKFYIEFSTPMKEGEALQYITLLNDKNDTMRNVFLDLQAELWNPDRTVLTIWLDPGRIKRGLIPNKHLGNPLDTGKYYTLAISSTWQNTSGLSLATPYRRTFKIAARDSVAPGPGRWKLTLPYEETNQPLIIDFGEPLDYFLLQETINIIDNQGKLVKGLTRTSGKEMRISFHPIESWVAGIYVLRVASILEDVAGNNLNRVFDREISDATSKPEMKYVERRFSISSKKNASLFIH